jgi:hypothetical protein
MEVTNGSLGLLAALCVGAGAAGAYFATRGDTPPARPEAVAAAAADATAAPAPEAVDQRPRADTSRRDAAPVAARHRSAAERGVTPAPPADKTAEPGEAAPVSVSATTETVQRPPEPGEAAGAAAQAQPATPAEPTIQHEELVVAADSVVGLEVETTVSSERARIEEPVVARVTRDVRVADRVAIPAGSRAHGTVTLVERGGRLRDRARLGVRFSTIVLPDGTRVAIRTDTVFREDSPAMERNTKIGGGAVAGAIIGGILGGAKGAAIGGSAGAGAGTAAVMAGGRSVATLPAGTPVTVRLLDPATVLVERSSD